MFSVDMLGEESFGLIDAINGASEAPLIHYSSSYLRFLLSVVPGATLRNFVAVAGGLPVAFLPILEQSLDTSTVVLNSLPFYGSHGGPCLAANLSEPDAVQRVLLRVVTNYASSVKALSLIIIENPLAPIDSGVVAAVGLDVIDDRIGQFTRLPRITANVEDLLAVFHQKTRNAVRKGYQVNQQVREVTDGASLSWLQQVHAEAIGKLGGQSKPLSVFERLTEHLPLGTSSKMYIGYVDGQPVSGLLVLLFNKTVEYFTPVATQAFKNEQVLSALIADVMRISARDGYELWNWGGTWRSQEGVYRFKNRFGATDHPYRYFGKVFDWAKLRDLKQSDQSAFPYFYLYRY